MGSCALKSAVGKNGGARAVTGVAPAVDTGGCASENVNATGTGNHGRMVATGTGNRKSGNIKKV